MTERSVVVRLKAETAAFQAKMVAAGKTAEAAFLSSSKAAEKNRAALTTVGNAAGIMGAAAAAGVGVAVMAAANFDKAMSSVQAATRSSAGEMERLRGAALKAGADTAFSASEAASGIENLAKAGVSTQDILRGGLTGALDLAAAGQIDVATAAESAATAMTQFGLSGSDVPHVADLLAAAAGKAQGEVTDFSMALNQSGLVANQTGLSIEETTAALAAFASQGLIGSDAGTSLKTMLQSLTPSSEKAASAMEQYNIEAYDAQGNFVGLEEFAGKLARGLGKLSDEQRNATLKTIFGSDAVRAATVLYEQGADGIANWTRKVNDQGFAAETAATKMDNLAGDLEELKGALETALIGAGSGAQGPLRDLTQNATDAVNAFNDMPQVVKDSTLALGGLVAVTGGGLFLGSRFISALADGKSALTDLGLTADRTKTALKGIGVGLAITAAVTGLDMLGDKIRDIQDLDLDTGSLNRELELLARTGRPAGQLLATMGQDFSKFGTDLQSLTASFNPDKWGDFAIPDWIQRSYASSRDNLVKLDDALVAMVEGGQIGLARRAFGELASVADRYGVSVKELRRLLPGYGDALDVVRARAVDAQEAERGAARWADFFGDALKGTTREVDDNEDAMSKAATTAEDLKNRMQALNAVLEGRAAFRDYKTSILDAREALKDNGRTLDQNTRKGLDNAASLDQIAANALAWAQQMKNVRQQNEFLDKSRKVYIEMAQDLGATRERAVKLANSIFGIPEKRTTKPEFDDREANNDVDGYKKNLDGIPKDPTTKPKLDDRQARNDTQSFITFFNNALFGIDDETVRVKLDSHVAQLALEGSGPLMRNAGGPVPLWGRPHVDSVPAMLTPNEHVATEPEVKAAGKGDIGRGHKVWQAIRKMALRGELMNFGDLQYLNAGGSVRPRVSERGFGSALDRIEAMFGAVADAYGDAISDKLNKMYAIGGGMPLGPGGTLSRGQVMMGQRFAKAQAGMDYQWGGTGNPSWDCSGLVGGTWAAALGRNPYQRYFTTASFGTGGGYGFRPGPGIFTVGNDPGSHMASNMGGLGVESRGGDGVVLGGGITPLTSFAHMAHYDSGGPLHPGWTLAYNGTGNTEYVVKGYAEGGKVTPAEQRELEKERAEKREERLKEQRQRERAIERAWKQFDITRPNMTREDVRGELRDLREALRENLGKKAPILQTLDRLDDRIIEETKDRAKLIRANEKLEEQLRNLKERRDQLASTVAGNFRNDIFEGGLDDLSLQLRADTNDARRMRRALSRAENKGLSGGLYRQLAESGNFLLAQQFAGLNAQQIRRYERMYATRMQVTGGLGSMVGREVYGQEIKENNREVRRNTKALNKHTRELRQHGRKIVREGRGNNGGARKRARA